MIIYNKEVYIMNERREVIMKDGNKGWLLGIFQYGSIYSDEGVEPLAVIEMEDGTIFDACSLSGFTFKKGGKLHDNWKE